MPKRRKKGYGPVERTEGWKKLVTWVDSVDPATGKKRSQGQLAELLHMTQPAVRGWYLRNCKPTEGPIRDAVCRITGSTPDEWLGDDADDHRAFLRSVAAGGATP